MLFFGCTPVDERRSWLTDQLYQDNRIWLQRDPVLLAEKFREMAAHPYNFMRGTVPLYYNDITRIRSDALDTVFLNDPESLAVPMYGDAHPENASVLMRPDETYEVEFVDLDSATYGPWTLDLRRGAMALRLLANHLEGCDSPCERDIIDGFLSGFQAAYVGEVFEFEQSSIWLDYLDEAAEEGASRKKLFKYTEEDESGRLKIIRNTYLDADGEGIFSLTDGEKRQAARLCESFSRHFGIKNFRILDRARKYGTGVSSRPATRYLVLWDTGGEENDDDDFIQFREILDPPIIRVSAYENISIFRNNAERISALEQQLWVDPSAEPYHHGFWDDGHGFKSLHYASRYQDVELHKVSEKWNDGDYTEEKLATFSRSLGWIIGNSHQNSQSLNGHLSADVVRSDVASGGGWDALRFELAEQSKADSIQYLSDFRLFVDLLEKEGEILGFDKIEGVP